MVLGLSVPSGMVLARKVLCHRQWFLFAPSSCDSSDVGACESDLWLMVVSCDVHVQFTARAKVQPVAVIHLCRLQAVSGTVVQCQVDGKCLLRSCVPRWGPVHGFPLEES